MRRTLVALGILTAVLVAGCRSEEAHIDQTATTTNVTATALQPLPTDTILQPAPTETALLPPTTATEAGQPAAAGTPVGEEAGATQAKLPKTHTVDHGGVMHAAGGDNPVQRCSACHGKDLRGGKAAKSSCFDCHEQVW
jgi:hypothetical protein